MRREVLFQAVSKIIKDLEESGISELFDQVFRESGEKVGERLFSMILEVSRKHSIATFDYSDTEKQICEILGIADLQNSSFYATLVERNPRNMGVSMNVRHALLFLPKLLSLLSQHYVKEVKAQEGDIPDKLKGMSVLTLLIIEERDQFSSPKRLTSALNAISELYAVIATIEKQHENDLIVLACDSGSDKSFDFAGPAKLMEQVKEIIIAVWDRKVFHRHAQTHQDMKIVAESLPIFKEIHDLETQKALSPEQAEQLRRQVICGVTHFDESGSTIPELDAEGTHDPRQLMKPKPKLLAFHQDEETPKEGSNKTPKKKKKKKPTNAKK